MQKLFTVEDTFKITGREGIVIAANLPPNLPELKGGENVILIKPEGQESKTEIAGIEMIRTVNGVRKIALLVKVAAKTDVPIGTEVFLEL